MDDHDRAALAHYEALIALYYPAVLAAALVAARYQVEIVRETGATLEAVRHTLTAVQQAHPDLKRDVGRTVAAIDRKGRNNHRS